MPATLDRMPDRARMALLAAAGFASALLITALVAFEWPLAAFHDANVLAGFRALASSPRIDTAARWIADAATPLPYVLLGAGFVGVALARGRPRLALAVPFAMAAASGTTEPLKLAGRVRYAAALGPYGQISVPSWPSGHATAAMMVALSAVLVSPPVLRPLAALLGSALAVAVSCSMLILTRHYPSDVLGGFLVAGTWMSLTIALLWSSKRRRVPQRGADEGAAGARWALLPAALAAAVSRRDRDQFGRIDPRARQRVVDRRRDHDRDHRRGHDRRDSSSRFVRSATLSAKPPQVRVGDCP